MHPIVRPSGGKGGSLLRILGRDARHHTSNKERPRSHGGCGGALRKGKLPHEYLEPQVSHRHHLCPARTFSVWSRALGCRAFRKLSIESFRHRSLLSVSVDQYLE